MQKTLERVNTMKCSVIGCNKDCPIGDILFCVDHRGKWVLFCIEKMVHEKQISEATEQALFNMFIEVDNGTLRRKNRAQ